MRANLEVSHSRTSLLPAGLSNRIGSGPGVKQMTDVLGLGNLLLEMTLFFALLIVIFEWLEVQREGKRERRLLDEIEREFEVYCRMGRL